MTLSSIIFIVTVLLLLFYILIIPIRNVYRLRKISSPKAIPVLGNAIDMWRAQEEFNKVLDGWAKEYGTRLTIWCSYWFPLVVLGNYKDVKVLGSRDHVEKGLFYKAFDESIGSGAFNSPVTKWKKRRGHLEKAFHGKVLSLLPSIFDRCGKTLVEEIKESGLDKGKVFDVHPLLNYTSMQMIIEGTMGISVDAIKNRKAEFWQKAVDVYERGTYLSEYRMLRPWILLSDLIWKFSAHSKELTKTVQWSRNEFFRPTLANRRKIISQDLQTQSPIVISENKDDLTTTSVHSNNSGKTKKHLIFLDLLFDLQKNYPDLNLSDEDIIDELNSIYIAGHDASGKSMSFALLYLGFHPESQDRVAEELFEIFGEDLERPITETDLTQMRYLEACIKESLRLMPPVSFITRKAGCDIELDDQAVIPKGTEVAIAIYMVHRDPTVYPDPEEFKPERFLPENSKGRDPFAWIPFSAGPRNCMGPKFAMMEDKIILAHILRNYKVESVGPKDGWILNTNVTLKLQGGWNIKLSPRLYSNCNPSSLSTV